MLADHIKFDLITPPTCKVRVWNVKLITVYQLNAICHDVLYVQGQQNLTCQKYICRHCLETFFSSICWPWWYMSKTFFLVAKLWQENLIFGKRKEKDCFFQTTKDREKIYELPTNPCIKDHLKNLFVLI